MDVPAEPVSPTPPQLTSRASASQRWSELAFVHWRVDSALVAPLLPPGLRPDEFDGTSWVGLIGFVLDRATLAGSPPIPFFGDFVEVNVRLYAVDALGRRGVVFVSLEAARLAAVLAARAVFSIPYFWSATSLVRSRGTLRYRSVRHRNKRARSDFSVRPSTRMVTDDALADFLTARWALFVLHRGHSTRLPNTHERWELYEATVESIDDTLLAQAGFLGLAGRAPDSVLYSPGVTAQFGSGERLA
jgi:uncharacterized protein YqjF (DUF2071 family)